MDELKKLYDVLVREGKYTKSFDEFKNQWGDDGYRSKVFDVVSRDGLYTKDRASFDQKYSGTQPAEQELEPLKKKEPTPLDTTQVQQSEKESTMASPSDGTSLASQSQLPADFKIKPSQDLPQGQGQPFEMDLTKPAPKRAPKPIYQKIDDYLVGIGSEAIKSVVQVADDVINSSKNILKEEGFFDDETPETESTAFDFIKNKVSNLSQESLLPGSVFAGQLIKKIINSSLSQEQKNEAIKKLNVASNAAQGMISDINAVQKEGLPEGNIPTEVLKTIVGMAPDLLLAEATGGASVESRLAKWAERSTKNAAPLVQKVAPKAAKILEESVKAPFTKIMATKAALGEMAKTEEGENVYWNGLKGGVEGALEGMYMHGLGVAAGQATPKIAKAISKSGLNSAIATAVASPLSNAGVFTTAKALRTAVTEQRLISGEEAALEAGTGIGFSLLHLGSQYKNQKELNHYYDNVLREDAQDGSLTGFGRVLNETKPNLDLSYNPNITEAEVKRLEEARDELRDAILKEPDLKQKQILGNEAIKLQNQIDAFYHVNGIVENRNVLVDEINGNDKLSDEQKKFYTNKINAIADTYDNSEFAVKKRELNEKITKAQDELDKAGETFSDLRRPSDIAEAKVAVDEKRAELERLNNEMTELVINKQKEDAIQKSKANESVLRTEETELGLREVGEGNQPKQTEGEEAIPTKVEEKVIQTTSQLESLPVEEKMNITFTQPDGTETPVMGNEKMLADMYHEAIGVPEAERTTAQQSAIDATEVSLKTLPKVEEKPLEKPTDEQILNDVNDGNVVTFVYKNEADIPEQFKDKVSSRGETNGEPIIRVTIAKSLADYELAKAKEKVSLKTLPEEETPKLARQVSMLITPATVRSFNKMTKRVQKMSLEYDRLVKEFNKTQNPKIAKRLRELESSILDTAKKEMVDDLSKIDGVAVRFKQNKRGLWEGKFEPSFNVDLIISPQADTKSVSKLLHDFAEKYSQDAFILETDSEFNDAITNGEREMPLTEYDPNTKLTHYPQITYTFKTPITDEQVAKLSVSLQDKGVDAFNVNNNELKISVIKFFPDDTKLTENEQYAERERDYESKLRAAAETTNDVLGRIGDGEIDIRARKSHYEGAINEGSKDQTRQYNRGDVLEAFKKSVTREEKFAIELAKLREKEIELQKKGQQLSPEEKTRFEQLNEQVQPTVELTFEANKRLYEKAKEEVENIAAKAIKDLNASISPFPIKRPARASVKTIRWYGSFTERLGDGARVNIIVESIADANKVFDAINKENPKDTELRRINDDTELGYPKRLLEVRASNGIISEIQVMTKEAYLAKDGVRGFTGGETQVNAAVKKLAEIRKSIGWEIPDGLGHYFYEIERDVNIDKELRDEATRLSKLYYDAFTNPKSELPESFMQDVIKFKEQVDAADKSTWDKGNEGKAPESLNEYISSSTIINLPGYERMMGEVDGIVAKSKERGAEPDRIRENVMEYVKKSKVYETATDVQREKLVRKVNEMFGVKEKTAPSVNRILGKIKDVLKITSSEKVLLKKQIRDLARGAKDAKDAIKKAENELTVEIKKLASSGKITAKQAANVLREFSKTNVLSAKSIDKFTNYMAKVFENAEYANKLSDATSMRKDLSKLSKNADKNANLRDLASQFAKIDPALVEDIDVYNDMASKITESIKGSKIRGEKVEFADMVNIEDAVSYTNKTMKAQEQKIRDYLAEDIQELMGIDTKGMTYEQLKSLIDKGEPMTKYQETIVRDALRKAFGINSSIIKSMLTTGVDAFTGEKVEYTKGQKDIISRFMEMDIEKLSPKEAAETIDALANFIQNKSTAKMEAVVSEYAGKRNAEKVLEKGITGVKLRKFFSPKLGELFAEQTTTLPQLFERIFKGVNRGGIVEDYSGMTKLKNQKSAAQSESARIVKDYVSKFYDKKANAEKFNTRQNNIERKMAAHMMRNVIGTESEMQTEFNRRKGLIEQSIENLKRGNDLAKAKAELYQNAYDKIVKDSKSIKDIRDKVDKTNLEAVDFWIKEWADKYDDFYNVALNVYNKVLDKDINYTPDKVSNVEGEPKQVDLKNDESAFFSRNDNMPKKESSVLMEATGADKLNKGTYIDLDFDGINSNAMYDALVDTKTASAIRQVDAFINSDLFGQIMGTPENADLMSSKIKLYVKNTRNKNPYADFDEMSKTIRKLNRIAAIGVGQSLGRLSQPFTQTIPVAFNTLINAQRLDLGAVFHPDKYNFISNSGQSIANRGVESQAQIESINRLISLAAESKGEKAVRFIEEANKKLVDLLLVKPDVYIARASWLSYYEKGLKRQGINPKDIDYKTHEVNEDAANYATRMVDRQQNVSDHDLAGRLFSDKNEYKSAMVKLLMPFASFRMNQATRLANDLSTIGHWKTSTTEDKAIAAWSLAGFGVEMAVFKGIAGLTSLLLGTAAKKILGQDEDEEEYQKRKDSILKNQATSTVTDVLSPFPILDKIVQDGVYMGVDKVQDMMEMADEEKFNIRESRAQDYLSSLGLFGIALKNGKQIIDLASLSSTGKFTDEFGKQKWINVDDKDGLKLLIMPSIIASAGLAPADIISISRNAINYSKKSASEQEGGKTKEDLEMDEYRKAVSAEKKEKVQEQRMKKVEALEKLRERTSDQSKIDAIDNMISELSMTDEERSEYRKERKNEKLIESEQYQELLQGYDSKSDMKKYDPELYEKTFGEGSDYYRENKDENEVEDAMNEILKQEKEKERGYSKPKKKKKKTWQDRSYKSTRIVRDAEGNIISSSSYKKNWED